MRDAAEKRQVLPGLAMELEITLGKPVMHGADPVLIRQRNALRVGDRHQRQFAELLVEWHEIGQIETAVHA